VSGWAIFDVDHTLIDGSTGVELLRAGIRRNLISFRLLLSVPYMYMKYRFGNFDPRSLHSSLAGLEGFRMDELKELSEEVFHQRIRRRIFKGAVEAIRSERARGRTVVLATSSVECAVRPLARYLEVDRVISSRFEVHDGRLTGRFHDAPAFGREKHRKVERMVAEHGGLLEESSFYSDSYHDLPLLEEVGEPVAVNADPRLSRTAARLGWQQRRFRRYLENGNGDGRAE
jgi:putative phosphoserine phosphatase/1-acylglycerol-3-phosphate O-acyltransferase